MDDSDSTLYARDFEKTNVHIIPDLLNFREKIKNKKKREENISLCREKPKILHSEVIMPHEAP